MRLSFAIVALFSLSVSATLLPRQLPSCASPCLTGTTVTDSGTTCSATDNACLCRDQKFVDTSTTCITKNCLGSDLTTAVKAAQSICQAFGVTLTGTLPTGSAGSGASSTAAGASTTATHPAGSGSASSAAPSATKTSSGASTHGVNALAGLAAVGLAALVL